MDFNRNETVFTSRWIKYVLRVAVLYIISAIFKSFDMSFVMEVRRVTLRSNVFSILYILYGLLVWEGAVIISSAVEKKLVGRSNTARLFMICVALLLYGGLSSFGFGFLYAVSDVLLFKRYEAWQSFKAVSYDLNFGTFLFYMMLLTFNGVIHYYKEWKEYQLQTERLMRENIQARYDALRNQIDPHFFFNSLSVLTNLVYKGPDIAADYITQLAKTYRYILDKKFENLVSIQTELDFLASYLFLIRIRHQDSIRFADDIEINVKQTGFIPPATLQMLVENAIKHNRFSNADPLFISIENVDDYLLVKNRLKRKAVPESPSGIGLENIKKRYELMSDKNIEIYEADGNFIVKIPIIEQYESSSF